MDSTLLRDRVAADLTWLRAATDGQSHPKYHSSIGPRVLLPRDPRSGVIHAPGGCGDDARMTPLGEDRYVRACPNCLEWLAGANGQDAALMRFLLVAQHWCEAWRLIGALRKYNASMAGPRRNGYPMRPFDLALTSSLEFLRALVSPDEVRGLIWQLRNVGLPDMADVLSDVLVRTCEVEPQLVGLARRELIFDSRVRGAAPGGTFDRLAHVSRGVGDAGPRFANPGTPDTVNFQEAIVGPLIDLAGPDIGGRLPQGEARRVAQVIAPHLTGPSVPVPEARLRAFEDFFTDALDNLVAEAAALDPTVVRVDDWSGWGYVPARRIAAWTDWNQHGPAYVPADVLTRRKPEGQTRGAILTLDAEIEGEPGVWRTAVDLWAGTGWTAAWPDMLAAARAVLS